MIFSERNVTVSTQNNSLGIYIHIPFCARKCAYCDFYSVTTAESARAYTSALIEQIRSKKQVAKNRIVDTIFIGGGTPSLIHAELISKILDTVRDVFDVAENAEISMEANPGTLDGAKLAAYRAMGINRLSIGLQSADNEELSMLSRIHTREEFENSFMLARMEGFDNINVDLIYALPHQTKASLEATLDYVISMSPEHISFYGLKIEDSTPFGKDKNIQKFIPDDDVQYEMYMDSCKKLEHSGYIQYEISNFSKPEKACNHNIKYWTCNDYIGFGPAAYSFIGDSIYSYARDVEGFIADPNNAELIDSCETLSKEQIATQYVMVGFRLRVGINAEDYEVRFGESFDERYGAKLQRFLDSKHIIRTEKGYRLSRRGMMISNYILSEILDF